MFTAFQRVYFEFHKIEVVVMNAHAEKKYFAPAFL